MAIADNTARVMPDRLQEYPAIIELEEVLEDIDSWAEEEGIKIDRMSVRHAMDFVKNALIPNGIASPYVEVRPDGDVAFTWRKRDRGIINIAFTKEGVVTWAVFLDKTPVERDKGRFNVKDSISKIEKYVRFITEA